MKVLSFGTVLEQESIIIFEDVFRNTLSKQNYIIFITVYTRVQVERVYKSNPIFEAKNTTFLEKV